MIHNEPDEEAERQRFEELTRERERQAQARLPVMGQARDIFNIEGMNDMEID
jgi:hypothetical protein